MYILTNWLEGINRQASPSIWTICWSNLSCSASVESFPFYNSNIQLVFYLWKSQYLPFQEIVFSAITNNSMSCTLSLIRHFAGELLQEKPNRHYGLPTPFVKSSYRTGAKICVCKQNNKEVKALDKL